MIASTDHVLPFLFFRKSPSRSMGIARFQSTSQGMFLSWDWMRCLVGECFFIFRKRFLHFLWPCVLSLYAQLQCACEILLCRTIRWVLRRRASWRSSQCFLFLLHQYVLMSSSLGMPTWKELLSKLIICAGWTSFLKIYFSPYLSRFNKINRRFHSFPNDPIQQK